MINQASQAAFEAVKPKVPSIRERVLAAITEAGSRGMTASELIELTGTLDYSVRPRITELRKAGIIQAAPLQRENRRNNTETVFILGDADKEQPKSKYDVDEYVRVLKSAGVTRNYISGTIIWSHQPEGRDFWAAVYSQL